MMVPRLCQNGKCGDDACIRDKQIIQRTPTLPVSQFSLRGTVGNTNISKDRLECIKREHIWLFPDNALGNLTPTPYITKKNNPWWPGLTFKILHHNVCWHLVALEKIDDWSQTCRKKKMGGSVPNCFCSCQFHFGEFGSNGTYFKGRTNQEMS